MSNASSTNSKPPLRRRAVFVGSFDPFHDGHRNIVARSLALFDEVVIGVSINDKKTYATPLARRVAAIEALYRDEPRVVVAANDGLTVAFAHAHHACCIVKGVRNAADFLDEQQQARWNKQQGGIDTLLFVADEGLEEVSSTALRAPHTTTTTKEHDQ